jgi:hypothetical protein
MHHSQVFDVVCLSGGWDIGIIGAGSESPFAGGMLSEYWYYMSAEPWLGNQT